MERDANPRVTSIYNPISTHTLTWSVTQIATILNEAQQISTHTLTWSVTINAQSKHAISINFNSHAHVERDIYWQLFRI